MLRPSECEFWWWRSSFMIWVLRTTSCWRFLGGTGNVNTGSRSLGHCDAYEAGGKPTESGAYGGEAKLVVCLLTALKTDHETAKTRVGTGHQRDAGSPRPFRPCFVDGNVSALTALGYGCRTGTECQVLLQKYLTLSTGHSILWS